MAPTRPGHGLENRPDNAILLTPASAVRIAVAVGTQKSNNDGYAIAKKSFINENCVGTIQKSVEESTPGTAVASDNDDDDDDDDDEVTEEDLSQSQSLFFSQTQQPENYYESSQGFDSQMAVQQLLLKHSVSPPEKDEKIDDENPVLKIPINVDGEKQASKNEPWAEDVSKVDTQLEPGIHSRYQKKKELLVSGHNEKDISSDHAFPPNSNQQNHYEDGTDADAALIAMERSGEMTQIVGSQSLCTQEMILYGKYSQPVAILMEKPEEDEEEPNETDPVEKLEDEVKNKPPSSRFKSETAHFSQSLEAPPKNEYKSRGDLKGTVCGKSENSPTFEAKQEHPAANENSEQNYIEKEEGNDDEDDDEHQNFEHSQNTVNTAVLLEALESSGALDDSQQLSEVEMPPPSPARFKVESSLVPKKKKNFGPSEKSRVKSEEPDHSSHDDEEDLSLKEMRRSGDMARAAGSCVKLKESDCSSYEDDDDDDKYVALKVMERSGDKPPSSRFESETAHFSLMLETPPKNEYKIQGDSKDAVCGKSENSPTSEAKQQQPAANENSEQSHIEKQEENEDDIDDDDEHHNFEHSQNTVNTAVLLEALESSGALDDSQQLSEVEMPTPSPARFKVESSLIPEKKKNFGPLANSRVNSEEPDHSSHDDDEEDVSLKKMEQPGDTARAAGSCFKSKEPDCSSNKDDEEEDAALKEMERSGDMTQVAGSQSLLSQELNVNFYQPFAFTRVEEEEEDNGKLIGTKSLIPSLETTDKRTPASTARKYGLLLPREGEPDENEAEQDKQEDDGEEDEAGAGGQNLSQTSLLRDLILSQDSTGWMCVEDSQKSEWSLPPPVGLATTRKSNEDVAKDAASAKPDEQYGNSRSLFGSKGLEALMEAAEHVSCRRGSAAPKRQSSRRPKRRAPSPEPEPEHTKKGGKKGKAANAVLSTKNKAAPADKCPPRSKSASSTVPKKRKTVVSSAKEPLSTGKASKRKTVPAAQEEEDVAVPKKKTKFQYHSSEYKKPDYQVAQEAVELALRVAADEDLNKQLMLSMVMERQSTRTPPSKLPPSGHDMPASFVWAHYPPMEKVLRDHMEKYYHLSLQKRQSAAQQIFNNELVQIVRKFAKDDLGYTINSLDDKGLRDRIRCYYKTHIQNAKKRLATMLKNPRKVANARHLVHHLELIKATLATASSSSGLAPPAAATSSSGTANTNGQGKAPPCAAAGEDDDSDESMEEMESKDSTSQRKAPKGVATGDGGDDDDDDDDESAEETVEARKNEKFSSAQEKAPPRKFKQEDDDDDDDHPRSQQMDDYAAGATIVI